MKEFILENWKIIAAIFLTIVSTILSTIIIVKKSGGKISVWDVIKAVILEQIPSFIAIVETEGHGDEKRNKVLNMTLKEAEDKLGRPLSNEENQMIIALASKQIEVVLAAPQKKEINKGAVQKSKYRV